LGQRRQPVAKPGRLDGIAPGQLLEHLFRRRPVLVVRGRKSLRVAHPNLEFQQKRIETERVELPGTFEDLDRLVAVRGAVVQQPQLAGPSRLGQQRGHVERISLHRGDELGVDVTPVGVEALRPGFGSGCLAAELRPGNVNAMQVQGGGGHGVKRDRVQDAHRQQGQQR
jgi:hypothetical protein